MYHKAHKEYTISTCWKIEWTDLKKGGISRNEIIIQIKKLSWNLK